MRRMAFVLAIGSLAVAGCGGSSNNTATATTALTGGGSISTTAGGATATTKPPNFSGSSGSSFCDDARGISQTTKFNPTTNLKANFQQFDSFAGRFESEAPSAIKADAKTLVDAVKAFESLLQTVNYDVTKLTPAQVQGFADPNFIAAGARVEAYLTQVCHITTTTSTP